MRKEIKCIEIARIVSMISLFCSVVLLWSLGRSFLLMDLFSVLLVGKRLEGKANGKGDVFDHYENGVY